MHAYIHTRPHTPEWNDPSHSFRVPAGHLSECDIFISVEDLAVNPCCLLSSVPDQTVASTKFITEGGKGGKKLFKKALNQPWLNEQHPCQDLFVPQMALFSQLHSWLTTSHILLFHFLFWLMCPAPSSFIPDLPFLYHTCLSFPITPSLPLISIPLACINVNQPHIWKERDFFFRNRAGWRERVTELVVKRSKSIKLNGNFKKRVVSWICIALVIHFLYHSTFKQNRCCQFQLEMTLKDFESISTDSVYLHLTRVSVAKNVTLTK